MRDVQFNLGPAECARFDRCVSDYLASRQGDDLPLRISREPFLGGGLRRLRFADAQAAERFHAVWIWRNNTQASTLEDEAHFKWNAVEIEAFKGRSKIENVPSMYVSTETKVSPWDSGSQPISSEPLTSSDMDGSAEKFSNVAPAPSEDSDTDAAVRRGLDVMVALMAIVFLLPLLLVVALAVAIDDPGPLLFRQVRVGRHGRPFTCLKFRSMRVNAELALDALLRSDPSVRAEWEANHKLKTDPRITRIGGFMRKSSLDELPQLWNVLRGEMSLVGPRPIVVAEIPRYGRHFRHYCSLKPGVTGLWQVSGRSDIDYRKRVVLDVAYARNLTAILNLKLLLATIPAVMLRRGSC